MTISQRSIKAFRQALRALNESRVPYVVGGAFAMHHYSGIWRNTNDLDIYLEREYVPRAVAVLSREGFRDYGETAAGDREWIYHAVKARTLVDLIWQPPNRLSPVDESLYTRGRKGTFLGVRVRFMPPDELMWAKVFTMNRQRCDWPDVFQLVRACPEGLDWNRLLHRMGEHWPVLLSFIILYDWAYPREAEHIPQHIRKELLERKRELPDTSAEPTREAVLDPWVYTRPVSP